MPPTKHLNRLVPLLAALVLLAGCGKPEPEKKGGGPQAVPVTTMQVRMQPFSDSVQAVGTVAARESVAVTAKVSEVVQRVHFESGQQVARGAPLVTLSGTQQQASLAAAQATANEANQLYRRNSALAEQQLIARAQLDAQRATRDAANAQVNQIRANLADRVVRAPFAGVLGIRQVSPGALVTPGTVIATLDDIRSVHVDFPLPEARLGQLGVGQRLRAISTAWPGRDFEGMVSTVESRVDPATRAVRVRADFSNGDGALRPGMLMNVALYQSERQALLVPEIAVVQVGRETFVFVVDGENKVAQRPVVIGARSDGQAEIVEGLKPGERIVTDGVGKLRTGQTIRETAAVPVNGTAGEAVAGDKPAAEPAPAKAAGGN